MLREVRTYLANKVEVGAANSRHAQQLTDHGNSNIVVGIRVPLRRLWLSYAVGWAQILCA